MSKVFKKMLLSVTAVFVLVVFNACLVEAKSLKKGEVYSLLNGEETMEVISGSELEITEGGKTFVAEYEFKGDNLRVVANVMGTKMVQYYMLTNEGLKDEKTGKVYYSKAVLATLQEKMRKRAAEEKQKREAEEKKRRAEAEKRNKFTDNGNGTVTRGTGLMWQKEDDNNRRNKESAITYCEGLSLGGYSDWRLPNTEELRSIMDRRFKPIINPTFFSNTKASDYWSSSDTAQWVNFDNDYVMNGDRRENCYVRCVRAEQ